jgi:uncharacterized membrane protein YfcA
LKSKKYAYLFILLLIDITWLIYMSWRDLWHIYESYWVSAVTMIFGSFVAGATAEGGAFIAFPVFTKLLGVSAEHASVFGLMIQSIGMTSASFAILAMSLPVIKKILPAALVGGMTGMLVGLYWIDISEVYAKLLFTFLVTSFAVVLLFRRVLLKGKTFPNIVQYGKVDALVILIVGVFGGYIASKTGTGLNIMIYIALVLGFRISSAIALPTAVICMACCSVFGFLNHAVTGKIGDVWFYWLAAVPVVTIGAPLGSYLASKVKEIHIENFLIFCIGIELLSTLLLTSFSENLIKTSMLIMFLSLFLFASLILYYQFYVSYKRVV